MNATIEPFLSATQKLLSTAVVTIFLIVGASDSLAQQKTPDLEDFQSAVRALEISRGQLYSQAVAEFKEMSLSSLFLTEEEKKNEIAEGRAMLWQRFAMEYDVLFARCLDLSNEVYDWISYHANYPGMWALWERNNKRLLALRNFPVVETYSRNFGVRFNPFDFLKVMNGEGAHHFSKDENPFAVFRFDKWPPEKFIRAQAQMELVIPNWYSSEAFLMMLASYTSGKVGLEFGSGKEAIQQVYENESYRIASRFKSPAETNEQFTKIRFFERHTFPRAHQTRWETGERHYYTYSVGIHRNSILRSQLRGLQAGIKRAAREQSQLR